MADTLTFENTQEVTTIDNLSAEEQDSLQVGEAMLEAQDDLLAGKYKNAQELEKAYVELQKKIGEKNPEDSESTGQPDDTTEGKKEDEKKEEAKEETQSTVLDDLWNQTQSGQDKFDEQTLQELSKMNAGDVAKMHLDYRKSVQDKAPEPAQKEFSEADVKELKGIVGGDKNYDNMLTWATQNLTEQEVDMFDTVMERGDPIAAFFAVRSLAYRYNDAIGYDGKMVTGKAPKTSGDTFRSQAEMVAAMSDPRYDNDPAYRRDIMEKVERSDIKF